MEKVGGEKRFCRNLGGSALIINALPPKFLKIVATRGDIFSLKFTKYRLAAGLCPDPMGELKRSPRPPSHNKGDIFLRGGEGRGKGREGEGELAPR